MFSSYARARVSAVPSSRLRMRPPQNATTQVQEKTREHTHTHTHTKNARKGRYIGEEAHAHVWCEWAEGGEKRHTPKQIGEAGQDHSRLPAQ